MKHSPYPERRWVTCASTLRGYGVAVARFAATLLVVFALAVLAESVGVHLGKRADAQTATPGLPLVPLGYCQLSAAQLAASIGLSSCVRALFTGTGSGTSLTTSAVTGIILSGDSVAGTGVPAGTTIVSQTSGTTGGAGVYVTSAATTSSGASLTSGGIPSGARSAYIEAETAGVRYRDDGGAPTAAIGMIIGSGTGIFYPGTLSALRFILQTGSPLVNVAFYR